MSDNDGFYVIYADGACRDNPGGPMGIGALIINPKGKIVCKLSSFVGLGTNNQAEYFAVILALKHARDVGAHRVELHMNSELVVRQLTGEYRVKNEDLQPLHQQALKLLRTFKRWRCVHTKREENSRAAKLAKKALDQVESRQRNLARSADVVG